MKPLNRVTVVLGASPKAERYSNLAVAELHALGHQVIPVHPVAEEIRGVPAVNSLDGIRQEVDTLTVYVNAERSSALREEILALHPRRVVFNPGAENPGLQRELKQAGITVETACTLILLRTNQY